MDYGNGVPTEGIFSLLDTDIYKLTMQCAVLKFFPNVQVSYTFTNRTPQMKLNRKAYKWLQEQIRKLADLRITGEELAWLEKTFPYLSKEYLQYLRGCSLRPEEQVKLTFAASSDNTQHDDADNDDVLGDISLSAHGLWVETILYEIPLLALVSEAYFKFVDRDWNHEHQVENAKQKALKLIEHGCVFSEFGSRRRRDYRTHAMVIQGLLDGASEAGKNGKDWTGKLSGTSNVHLAMRLGTTPVGTVGHEWFMGIAAITDDYANANEVALRYWVGTFGRGVLAIALTDTFGTPAFLRAFVKPAPQSQTTDVGVAAHNPTYAQAFTGVRQDSGDPLEFLRIMKEFYSGQGLLESKTEKKVIVYSDSLDVEKCIQYKKATDEAGLTPSFGVGTSFTNDFKQASRPAEKSVPLNIVIKLTKADGRPCVKLSDNEGKNMGGDELVAKVKKTVDYHEKTWREGDEAHRWDR